MKREIIILHGKNDFFGQTRKPWVSMDLKKMVTLLRQQGFNVSTYEYSDVINKPIEIKDSIIFYSFSQKENVRKYIKDLIHHLSYFNNFVIPSYDLLLCHENKGYQELLKNRIGIKSLKSLYFNDKECIDFSEIEYPSILKKIDGSNGNYVYLVKNEYELKEKLKNFEKLKSFEKMDLFRRKYFRSEKHYEHYPNYTNDEDLKQYKEHITQRDNFIIQEFVPNLKYDYRILAIYDKFFVTRRINRENDFRASGAKKYDFSFELDNKMLDYSKTIYQNFDTPFLSMDVCKSNGKYYLLEYQAIHFGLNVVVRSNGYYIYENNNWNFVKNINVIEEEIVYGLKKYIKSKCP